MGSVGVAKRRRVSMACRLIGLLTLLTPVSAEAGAAPTADFVQQGPKLAATNEVNSKIPGELSGQFGYSVALSEDGTTALVGGSNDDAGIGAAWIFTRAGSSWKQGPKLIPTGLPTGNAGETGFGYSVALSADGNTALVGSPKYYGDLGAAWVFVRAGGGWTQQARLLSVTTPTYDLSRPFGFGTSVALSGDGDIAIVGAPLDADNAAGPYFEHRTGAAFLFRRAGSSWSRLGRTMVGAGLSSGAAYGSAVALSADGSTSAVGGPTEDAGGTTLGGVWMDRISRSGAMPEGGTVVASDAVPNGSFGGSVALSANGDIVVVGSDEGAAWVFGRSGSAWRQSAKLTDPIPKAASSGWSVVAISGAGTIAVVGAPYVAGGAGSAWVFSGSGMHWGEASNLLSMGMSGPSAFGWSVGLAGDGRTLLVGGPNDATAVGAAWVLSQP